MSCSSYSNCGSVYMFFGNKTIIGQITTTIITNKSIVSLCGLIPHLGHGYRVNTHDLILRVISRTFPFQSDCTESVSVIALLSSVHFKYSCTLKDPSMLAHEMCICPFFTLQSLSFSRNMTTATKHWTRNPLRIHDLVGKWERVFINMCLQMNAPFDYLMKSLSAALLMLQNCNL